MRNAAIRVLAGLLVSVLVAPAARAQVVENIARPAIQRIQLNGSNLPREATLNFTGGGLSATDNPGAQRIDLAIALSGSLQSAYNAGYTSGVSIGVSADVPVSIDGAAAYPNPSPNPGTMWPVPSPAPGSPICKSPGWDDLVFAMGNRTGPNNTSATTPVGFGITGANEIVAFDPHVDGSCSGNAAQNWFQFFGGVDTVLRVGKSRVGQFFPEGGELRIFGGDGADDNNTGFGSEGGGIWLMGGLGGKRNSLGPQTDGSIQIDTGPNAANGNTKNQAGYGTYSGVDAINIGANNAPGVSLGHTDLSGNPASQIDINAGTNGMNIYSLGRWFIHNKTTSPTVYWDTSGPLSTETEFVHYDHSINLITPSATGGNAQGWLELNGETLTFMGGASPTYNTVFSSTPLASSFTTFDSDSGGHIAMTIKSNSTWTAGTLAKFVSNAQVRVAVQSGPGTPLEVTGNFSNLGQIVIQDSGEGSARGSGIIFTDTGSNGYLLGTSSTATSGNFYVENNSGSFAGFQMNTNGDVFPVNNIASQSLGLSASPWENLYLSGKVPKYNGETTAGTGVVYPEKVGQSVASTGAGAQSTTIATFTPATSGTYYVFLSGSCTTTDTVTATVGWTDADNTTAQSVTDLSAVVCATNGTFSAAPLQVRANTSAPIVATLTVSAHATTKLTATLLRAN